MRKTNLLVSADATLAAAARLPVTMLGVSEGARRAREAVEHAARAGTSVLIAVEPGCRPREVAAWLHACGRPSFPFLAVDCGAGDAAEIETRLFGGPARAPMPGDLEPLDAKAALVAATAGTVFLDNVEELPASAQRRLARVLRDGEARLPSTREPTPVRCRIVASTACDLEAEVREGRFRQDLLRRLSATPIAVPPLRQRPCDFAAIVERLLAEAGAAGRSLTQPAVTVLAALQWPDNVDELARVLSRVLASAGPVIRQEDVLAHLPIDGAFPRPDLTASLRDARRRFEREYIAAVLERHHWRMSEAAKTLGIERANLYRKARQLGIRRATRQELSR